MRIDTPQRLLSVLVLFSSISLVTAQPVLAQRSVIRGVVRNTAGNPIAEAAVRAESRVTPRVIETETDESGRFSFIGLERGRWLFTIQKRGYRSTQGFAPVRRAGNSGILPMTMEVDLFDPPVASTGALAGIRANDLQTEVDAANALLDLGDYTGAISASTSVQASVREDQVILEQVPQLTSLNLQIGHAYREKQDFTQARAAYRKVPSNTPASKKAESALQELDNAAPAR